MPLRFNKILAKKQPSNKTKQSVKDNKEQIASNINKVKPEDSID